MKNLIDKIEGLTIHETVRFIATLDANERQEMASIIEERYANVGINESKIIMNDKYVEGYAGNGFCTVGDKDYEERFLKIYFKLVFNS